MSWKYERVKEDLSMESCPINDYDGSVTGVKGKAVFNVPAWFDEHPEERIRQGWIKHIHPDEREIEYNRQTQYLTWQTVQIDEYTIEDVPHICDKSSEMMRLEEIGQVLGFGVSIGDFHFY